MPTKRLAAAPAGVQRAVGQLRTPTKRRSGPKRKGGRKMSAKQRRFFGGGKRKGKRK